MRTLTSNGWMFNKSTLCLKQIPTDAAAKSESIEQIGKRWNVWLVGAQNRVVQSASQHAETFEVAIMKKMAC